MKKSIYYSGIASANLMMFGCLFKIFHWPGANVLLCLAVALFCILFLPFALKAGYDTQENKDNKTLYTITFIVFFIGMLGILFKILHWPGAGLFLLFGVPLPFVLFLPVYLYYNWKKGKSENTNYLGIMFGLIFLAVFSVLLSLSISKNILAGVAGLVSSNTEIANSTGGQLTQLNSDDAVVKNANDLYEYIDHLKLELLDDNSENGLVSVSFDPKAITNMDNTETANGILLSEHNTKRMDELKDKIQAFRNSLLAKANLSVELKGLVNQLFDVSTVPAQDDESAPMSWAQREFATSHLIVVLDVLTQLQSNVRLVEVEALSSN